ncbi:MAG: hypothetical protein RMK61_01455 [Bacteroidota bacterium]|nr:hypothetical protein [Bacteroidota bacterium]MDW8137100.1 hypothetical protein [Bacteroidota bacterium]
MLGVFVRDLLWRSRIEPALRDQGGGVRWLERPEELEALTEPLQVLWVELSAPEALRVITRARIRFPSCRIIAFGPHMDADLLRSAQQAGADEVLSRSAFLGRYLWGRWAGLPPGG